MQPTLAALVALALLGSVPGALLYRAIRPTGSTVECAAIAPTLSFAFVFLFGEAATALSAPFAPGPFLGLVALAAVVATIRWWRGRASVRRSPPAAISPAGVSRPAALLLLGGIALGAGSWLLGIHGFASTPPYTDSVNHGLMAAQVASRESLDPRKILTSDAAGAAGAPGETAYYPLALHGEVALAHRLFGIGIADGLLAATFLFSAVVLPLGLWMAVRRLVPDNPLLAGLTALLGATTGFFPLLPLSFGGLPLVIGLAMVPAVAVVAGRYLTGDGPPADGAVGALGAVGILATHTSEIPLLAMFLAPAVIEAVWRRRATIRAVARRVAAFGLTCAVLTAPTLRLIAGGTAERSGIDEGRVASFRHALSNFRAIVGGGGADIVLLLAAVGVAVCVRRRRHLALLTTTAGVLGLYLIATGVQGPLRAVTVPWYQHPGRVALNLVLIIPFFAALAVAETLPALWARRAEAGNALVPVVGLTVALALAGFATAAGDLRVLFRERAVVGPDAQAAFSYLKTHVTAGQRVLNDGNTDGAMWMYAFDGVDPLLGLQPANPGPSWNDRLWLVTHLTDLGRDPQVRAGLDRYAVRYVYWDDRTFKDNPHHLDGRALLGTPGLCQVFRQGSVHLLEVTDQPACPAGPLFTAG